MPFSSSSDQQQQQHSNPIPPPSPSPQRRRCESKSLLYLLNPNRNDLNINSNDDRIEQEDHEQQQCVTNFFDDIYQNSVAVYRTKGVTAPRSTTTTVTSSMNTNSSHPPNHPPVYTPWSPSTTTTTTPLADDDHLTNNILSSSSNQNNSNSNPLLDVLEHGYSILYDLMNEHDPLLLPVVPSSSPQHHRTTTATSTSTTNHHHNNQNMNHSDILLFQNQQMISRSDDDMDVIMKYTSCTSSSNNNEPHHYNSHSHSHSQSNHITNTNNNTSTDHDEASEKTQTPVVVLNLHAAYLDGCSIVMNHADLRHPYIAMLCQDLQSSFPHVYANVYITPLSTQTVPAHADDRDVFIIQVVGCKLWTIYTNIPIPYPYPSEQVGKSNPLLPVPDQVRYGPILFSSILYPGDVLYIPRGYVHETQCVTTPTSTSTTTQPPIFGSFHITIAIATHDWSLIGVVQQATTDLLSSRDTLLPIHYRKAIDRQFGQSSSSFSSTVELQTTLPTTNTAPTAAASEQAQSTILPPPATNTSPVESMVSNEAVGQLQQQIDTILQLFQREITVANIHQALYHKYTFHNQRALQQRNYMIQQYLIQKQQQQQHLLKLKNDHRLSIIVGYDAARTMTLHTHIRAVTDTEKKMISTTHPLQQPQQQQLGLHVREEIYDDIMTILQQIKKTSTTYPVYQLRSFLSSATMNDMLLDDDRHVDGTYAMPTTTITPHVTNNNRNNMICDMTLLSLARRCVELGAFAIVPHT